MTEKSMRFLIVLAMVFSAAVGGWTLAAEETKPDHSIKIGPELTMTVPSDWTRKTPRVQIVEHEFAIPPASGDKEEGRMTVMAAGGSVEANIERWFSQFTQPDGGATRETAKVEKKQVAGHEVTIVDVAGTYRDSRGPFAPAVQRPGYRMLAAVVPTTQGSYFIKFYGPQKTVAANEKSFMKMIDGINKS